MRSRSLNLPDGRSLDTWVDDVDGVPLVFHFGTPSSGLPMDDHVAVARERGLRWISWSRPGYGSSSRHEGRTVADVVADTREVMDQLGLDRAYVAGWSGGGPHALACVALMPERFIGASTVASVAPYKAHGLDFLEGMGAENEEEFGAAVAGPDALAQWMEANSPGIREASGEDIAAALGDLVDHVDRAALTGDFANAVAANMHEGLRDGYFGWHDDDLAFVAPWGFDLASITTPVHIWQGAHDRMVPFAHGQWLAANCGGACVHLVPEHGHVSLVAAFGEILDEMVGRQRRAAGG
jgi:pimeloyl-ACP methyl ester carboxylesterase